MASVSVSIGLWNYAMVSLKELPSKEKSLWELYIYGPLNNWEDQLPLPESFKRDIDKQLFRIQGNTNRWISYHFNKIFFNKKNKCDVCRYAPNIIWHPNGAVNYYKTALNLLKSDKVDDLEKYRLACTYCLKEEIEKLWSALVENKAPNDAEFSLERPLISYWSYYCADKLHMVPVEGDLSIDEFMFRQSNVDNFPAMEYFFDRMNAEQQVACVIHFINRNDHKYQKLLLEKMNETQRLQVYTEKAVRIIQNYLRDDGAYWYVNQQNAISTWYEVRDLISRAQYVALMNRLCRAKLAVSNAVLMEIWTSSHDEFKLHIINHPNYDFIGDVLRWACRKRHSGLDFLDFLFVTLELGAKVGFKPLNQWTKYGRFFLLRLCAEMMGNGELELIIRVMNLCVPRAEDCAEAKQMLIRKTSRFINGTFIYNGCWDLITNHKFAKLEEFIKFFYPANDPDSRQIVRDLVLPHLECVDSYCLNFYLDGKVNELNDWLSPLPSSYPDIVLEYKKYLLFSDRGVQACYSHFNSTTTVLPKIVADGLPKAKDVIEFGKIIMLSDEGVAKLHKLIRDKNFPNAIVRRNINLFIKSNKDKNRLKKKLINSLTSQDLRITKAKQKYLQILFACGL